MSSLARMLVAFGNCLGRTKLARLILILTVAAALQLFIGLAGFLSYGLGCNDRGGTICFALFVSSMAFIVGIYGTIPLLSVLAIGSAGVNIVAGSVFRYRLFAAIGTNLAIIAVSLYFQPHPITW